MNERSAEQKIECQIRQAFDISDYDLAATLFIRNHGPEMLSFLAGRLRGNISEASEAFSQFAEDLWRGLPSFQWRTSIRSWAYTIARNAANRHGRVISRQRHHEINYNTQSINFAQVVAQIRTQTNICLRTETKDRVRELREQLEQDDQILLVLRVDRQLSWRELAAVMSGKGEQMDETEIERWSARLRKRFQLVKQRLKTLAISEGLIESH